MLDLTWDYPLVGPHDEPDAECVLQEISGRDGRRLVPCRATTSSRRTAPPPAARGSTAAIYADGVNQAARKQAGRASRTGSRTSGAGRGRRTCGSSTTAPRPTRTASPWSERKRYVWWDPRRGQVDRASATRRTSRRRRRRTSSPTTTPRRWRRSPATSRSLLHPDGRGWLYAPTGLVDGPLPAHYEPQESPFANPLYAQQQNPTRQVFDRPENPYNPGNGARGVGRVPVRAHAPTG